MTKKIIFSTLLLVASTAILSACSPEKQEQERLENANKEQTKEMAMEKDGSFKGSLKDLISFGKPQKCTWQENEEGASGVTYTDGKRSYSEVNNIPVADFKEMGRGEVNREQEKGTMYTMYDGEYVYAWSSNSNEGLKIKDMNENSPEDLDYDSAEEFADESEDNSEYLKTMESEIDYNCTNWKLDESKFNLPKGIEFKDFSEMMGEVEQNFEGVSNVCSMLEGEEQEDCIKDWAEAQEQMMKMGQ